jgi:hypothetical protein
MSGKYDENGHWQSDNWTDPLGSYRPALDVRTELPTRIEFKCVEVTPGILYVVELPMGEYALHLKKNSIVPLPHGAMLRGTFEVDFPDRSSTTIHIPRREL